jgi:hypothetical protein
LLYITVRGERDCRGRGEERDKIREEEKGGEKL